MPFEFLPLLGACVSTFAAIFSAARLFTRHRAERQFMHHLLDDREWCDLVKFTLSDRKLEPNEARLLLDRARLILGYEEPVFRKVLLDCIEQPNQEGRYNYIFKLATNSERQLELTKATNPADQADS